MRCSECGVENSPQARFCANCGGAIDVREDPGRPVYCTSCGEQNSRGARFCRTCGAAIRPPSGRPSPLDAALSSYAPSEYMGFWIRLGAQIADVVVLFAAVLVALLFISFVNPLAVLMLIPIILYGFYRHMKCQTLGRRLFRISVVDRTGRAIGFWRGMLREMIGKPISELFFYLGFIWVAFDARKQGWHDKIAGTYVIKRSSQPVSRLGRGADAERSQEWSAEERARL